MAERAATSGGRRTNPLAVVSVVAGVLWLAALGSVVAVVTGRIARRQIAESAGAQGGAALATAGVVTGVVGLAVLAVMLASLAVQVLRGAEL